MNAHFAAWRQTSVATLKALQADCHPKDVIAALAERLLAHYAGKPLIDPYDVYQHLMDYWAETMQDDAYIIAVDGWVGGVKTRELHQVKNKNGKLVWPEAHDFLLGKRRFKSDLVPGTILIGRFFQAEQAELDEVEAQLAAVEQELEEQREEHGAEGGLLEDVTDVDGDKRRITAKAVKAWLKENKTNVDFAAEFEAITNYGRLLEKQVEVKGKIKAATAALHSVMAVKYSELTESEIKTLVVDDKWLAALDVAIHGEIDRVSQQLTRRVKELAERYQTPLPQMADRVAELEGTVNRHLKTMGFAWK